jgi:2-dehydropantoate 2-reductase
MTLRTGIVGAGGIGGYLAAKLTAAGADVALLARGAQLAAMRTGGLRLIDPLGDLTVTPAALDDDPAILQDCDVVLYAVKAHQLPDAIAQTRSEIGPETCVVPFQNGIDAPDLLKEAFGPERAATGTARIFTNITAPGVVTRYGETRRFAIGQADQTRLAPLRAQLRDAGVDAPEVADIRVDLWMKFLLFNAASSMTAGTRCTFGQVRAVPEAMALTRKLMKETEAVARASGVGLPADAVDRTMAAFNKAPDEGRTSTAHDLAGGRSLEIDWVCGAMVRHGRTRDVPVPASETVLGLLAPWRNGPPE